MQDQQQEDPSIIAGSSSAEECEFVPSYFEEEKQAKTLIQVLLSPISGADGGEEGLTLLLTLDQAVEALEKIVN